MKIIATDLIIVSGLSGAGKSLALQSLEDIGYYCVDNLPVVMLPDFNQYLQDYTTGRDTGIAGVAVSIDTRNKQFLSNLEEQLDTLEQKGWACRVLFLRAEEQILVRRYSETRRKHPLTDETTPLIEAIQEEMDVLKLLHDRAEKIIDTTETTPHELTRLVRDFAGSLSGSAPLLLVESFGFKNGSPRDADFVFDVRCLPNPHWEPGLRKLNGKDQPVIDYLSEKSQALIMIDEIFSFIYKWLPDFATENRSYITVAIGCTGGQHRSVFFSEQLGAKFLARGVNVQVRHRQLQEDD